MTKPWKNWEAHSYAEKLEDHIRCHFGHSRNTGMGFFFPPLTTYLPSLLNLNALYFTIFCFRNLPKPCFALTRQGFEKPSFSLSYTCYLPVPPHAAALFPSPPMPGSPCMPPLLSSTHRNPWNRVSCIVIHDKEGFGTNTEMWEPSRSVLFSSQSSLLVPNTRFMEIQQPQDKSSLRKTAS